MNPLDILKNLAAQAVQKGAQAFANHIAGIVAGVQRGQGMTPAEVSLLLTEAKQNGIDIPQEQVNAMIGNKTAYTEAPADNPRAVGPGITSGTGQTVTVAQRAAQAAAAAAAGAGAGGQGDNFNPAQSRAQVTTTPATGQNAAGSVGYANGLPGNFTGAQATSLSQDDAMLLDFALRAAGLNPDRMTRFSKIAMNALKPLVQARRAAFGLTNGQGNLGGLPQDIASFAQGFTQKGNDFFGQAQNYANQVLNSDTFKNGVAGLGDTEQQQALYQGLMPLLFAGANPLVQQSAADTFGRDISQFNRADFNSSGQALPASGVFTDWLRQQPNIDPITRRIFGLP